MSVLYLHEVTGSPLGLTWRTRKGDIERVTAKRVFVRVAGEEHAIALDRAELELRGVCRGWSRHDTHPPIAPMRHGFGVWTPSAGISRGAVFVHTVTQ